jgi:hypothetical protein
MPNWVNNSVELYHNDPAMLERARQAYKDGRLLDEFIPVPEALKITAGYLGDGEEQRELERKSAENREKYGYANWYDYCVNEWGTKWDIGGDGYEAQDIPDGLMLTFDSAWSPPCQAYEKLTEQGFRIRAMYYEPGMAFAGIWEGDSEHGFDDDYYEYGGLDSRGIADTLPEELDEAFGISDAAAEYEAESADEDE